MNRLLVSATFFLAMLCHGKESTNMALLGCWRFEAGTSYLADGTALKATTKCTLQFEERKMVSRCVGYNGPSTTVYTYEIVAPSVYEAQITEHSALPSAVGSKRKYEFRIEDDRLFITTYPQTNSPAPLNAAVKFVSKSIRVAGTCGLEQ